MSAASKAAAEAFHRASGAIMNSLLIFATTIVLAHSLLAKRDTQAFLALKADSNETA
jgi:hypothetical protein